MYDSLPGPASDDQRTFKDACGRRWVVYERIASSVANPERLCLIFEAMHAVRRVSTYPRGWRAMDALALERLSWAR